MGQVCNSEVLQYQIDTFPGKYPHPLFYITLFCDSKSYVFLSVILVKLCTMASEHPSPL